MIFRPLPLLTLAALPALAILVALGLWQLGRAEEKRGLIAAYERQAALDAFPDLGEPFCLVRSSPSGHRSAMPERLSGAELRFFGARAGDGAPGWKLLRLTPAPDCACVESGGDLCDGPSLLVVEAGFETLAGERSGPPEQIQIVAPPRPNAFTSDNDPERGDFYRVDRDALAAGFGVVPEALDLDFWLAAYAPGLPPGLAAMPPSRHIGYAFTWFGIAATLIGVYIAFHVRQGRIGRPRSDRAAPGA